MSLLVLKAELKASNSVDRPSQVVLEILRLFWSIKRFFGGGGEEVWTFFYFILGAFWQFRSF